MNNKLERRTLEIGSTDLEFRDDSRKLSGHAALFNSRSADLGGFTEVIQPGAFRSALAKSPDVVLNFNHDDKYILGRTDAGTLRLSEDSTGLRFEADLADTQLIRDMVLSPMQRGELRKMSFAFVVNRSGQSWSTENGVRLRSISEFSSIQDVSVVTRPAYGATSVSLRTATEVLAEDLPAETMTEDEPKQEEALAVTNGAIPDPNENYAGVLDVLKKRLDLIAA